MTLSSREFLLAVLSRGKVPVFRHLLALKPLVPLIGVKPAVSRQSEFTLSTFSHHLSYPITKCLPCNSCLYTLDSMLVSWMLGICNVKAV